MLNDTLSVSLSNMKVRMKNIVKFFDKLEDKIRGRLSHYPILYAFIGGTGIVLFWRGVWHTADNFNLGDITSLVLGSVILLLTGVFVSDFIGNKLIISGLIGEKKISEKEENEIQAEESQLRNLQNTLNKVEKKIEHLEEEIENK